MIKLTTDNAQPRVVIETTKVTIENACKRVLGWRTPKGYDNIYERFMSSGSSNYDKVIKYINENY